MQHGLDVKGRIAVGKKYAQHNHIPQYTKMKGKLNCCYSSKINLTHQPYRLPRPVGV